MISLKNLNKPKNYLLLANIFLVLFLILLNNFKIIPLRAGDFAFFAFLILAFSLYRPGWAFLFFIGTIILENINLAPLELGISIRPYQFFGAFIILAIIIRLVSKKLYFEILKPTFFDCLVLIMVLAGFLSALFSEDRGSSLKLSVIFLSFAALYFLVRNYVQNGEDLKKIVPFFLASSLVVILYGIWQNWAFAHNFSHFEAMPGRPNGTFAEPDWLGIYLVGLLALIYSLIYYFSRRDAMSETQNPVTNYQLLITSCFLYFLLTVLYILLILTVSRSAWLGALAATFIFLFIIWTNLKFKNWQWKETLVIKMKILASFAAAVAVVYVFHLTNFQLFNRIESTGTGLQKITVACVPCKGSYEENDCNWKPFPIKDPVIIGDISDLEDYNCRHINLEDISKEEAAGNYITTAMRSDPNINIRSEIYKKTLEEIKKHPILGVGWGGIGKVLGEDERGTSLNSSNIFLETWLGSGVVGFLALIMAFLFILFNSIKNYFYSSDNLQKTVSLFIIVSWFSMIIPNLFNAGIFLGIFWVWLAVTQIKK
ncbi:MAG TPA: O-antigen ligase family protein [Candidatus Moranbacteria bacterium]|nr:O-antigen ligase family protein [Candidatus Moranbacteria bacterium]